MFDFTVKEQDGNVDVDLVGRLDATVAPKLHEALTALKGKDIKRVTFNAKELAYIASAGLRVIIFAKQKLGVDTEIVMKDVRSEVKEVLEMTGCDNFVQFI